MNYFNYVELARKTRLEAETRDAFVQRLEQEFPGDEMLMELHVVRACLTVGDRLARAEEMLRRPGESAVRKAPIPAPPSLTERDR